MTLMTVTLPMQTWQSKKPLPQGLSGGAVSYLSGRMIYAGGTSWRDNEKSWLADTIVYDPQADHWSHGPALPEPLAYGARVSTEHSLEVLGGASAGGTSRHCWRLNSDAGKWSPCGEAPFPSIFGSAESVHGRTLLFGGCEDVELKHCHADVMQRGAAGVWERVSEFPDGAVLLAASAVAKGSVYLFGGFVSDSQGNRDRALRYDPLESRWTKLKSLPRAARGMSAVALDEEHILVAGGYTNAPTGFSDDAYIYNIAHNDYVKVSRLPAPVLGAAFIKQGKTVWMLGGEDRPRHRLSGVFESTVPRLFGNGL